MHPQLTTQLATTVSAIVFFSGCSSPETAAPQPQKSSPSPSASKATVVWQKQVTASGARLDDDEQFLQKVKAMQDSNTSPAQRDRLMKSLMKSNGGTEGVIRQE